MTDRLVEIADRVFVGRYPQWDVNVGVVVGSAGICVIDTRGTLRQGREVAAEVGRLAPPRTATHVVNTHVHFDHVLGNAAFPGVVVTAHANAVAAMPAHIEGLKSLVRAEPEASAEHGYSADDLVDLLATPLVVPGDSFTQVAEIDLGDRSLRLSYAGRGHTDGDLAAVVSDVPVTFLGDLIESAGPPGYGDDCHPLDWAETLTAHLADLPPDAIVVPGHGEPVGRDFVAASRDSAAAVAGVVRERHTQGWSLADAVREPDARLPYPMAGLGEAFRRGYAVLGASQT